MILWKGENAEGSFRTALWGGESRTHELYRSYTSADGQTWEPGGAWTHQLGVSAKIGLVSMAGKGWHSYFDYVHVYQQP
jgi:hypothetical protein